MGEDITEVAEEIIAAERARVRLELAVEVVLAERLMPILDRLTDQLGTLFSRIEDLESSSHWHRLEQEQHDEQS